METSFKRLKRREPRWLTSFADLMALLVALFVMLLSFADLDSESFKKNASPINEAFVKDAKKPPTTSLIQLDNAIPARERDAILTAPQAAFRFSVILREELERQDVEIEEFDESVRIRFKNETVFQPGSRELTNTILPTLRNISDVLAKTKGQIHIEGHTDNIPISSGAVRSNWDLSAGRAASVVHVLLQNRRITPDRVSAVGMAGSRPLVDNDTPQNRAQNRRVEINLHLHPDDTEEQIGNPFINQ